MPSSSIESTGLWGNGPANSKSSRDRAAKGTPGLEELPEINCQFFNTKASYSWTGNRASNAEG